MANSRKLHCRGTVRRAHELSEQIAARIVPLLPAHSSILIGLSGGVDSVVLLHLLHQLAPHYSWRLSALHVHHGISPNADIWADFCSKLCDLHHIPIQIEHVDITPLRAYGIEAAARKLRHAAFAGQGCDFVALAHHADDQVETMLLQLLRGAGVRGASAMPVLSLSKQAPLAERAGFPSLVRPLLHSSRQEILAYAAANGLQWIDDESNADDSYPRNFLRHRLLPLLEEKFPAYRDTFMRSAKHFAEASILLDELAQQDSARTIHAGTLAVADLQALSQARAKNLVRYFLHVHGVPMPQTRQLDNMVQQLCNARVDTAVCITCGEWQVRRYQGSVYVMRSLGEFDRNLIMPWHNEAGVDWPALQTRLHFNHSPGVGISMAKLHRAPVTLRLRRGGESLRPHPNSAMRSLKNLLQEHRIPPWQRDRLPLLYCGDELVCVSGVAVAAEYQAAAGEAGIQLLTGQ